MGIFGFDSVADMFDGGGRGASASSGGGGGGGSSSSSGGGGGSSNSGGSSSGGYTSFRDMFDGGGAGQRGSQFEGGGALSNAANALGIAPAGSAGFTSFADRFDGGGPGQSGATFQGGAVSNLANAVGISPYGQGSGTVSGLIDSLRAGGVSPMNALPALSERVAAAQRDSSGSISAAINAGVAPTAPTDPAVDPNAPVSMNLLPPNLAMLLRSDIAVNPETMFTFEDYLAQLNRQGGGVMPPAIQSLMGPSVPPLMSAQPAAMPAMAQMPAPAQINPLVPMPTLSLQGIGSLTSTQPALANIASRVI